MWVTEGSEVTNLTPEEEKQKASRSSSNYKKDNHQQRASLVRSNVRYEDTAVFVKTGKTLLSKGRSHVCMCICVSDEGEGLGCYQGPVNGSRGHHSRNPRLLPSSGSTPLKTARQSQAYILLRWLLV